MASVEVPRPTVEDANRWLKNWDTLENYKLQEDALYKLFNVLVPENNEIEDILIKSSALNDFYSTNIFSIFPVAKHILNLGIDESLQAGDKDLVPAIGKISINGTNRYLYSFATKYCSHHQPESFPIYDFYLDKVLRHFRNEDGLVPSRIFRKLS